MRWTQEEIAIVKEHYPEMGGKKLADSGLLPNRTASAIKQRAAIEGVSFRTTNKVEHNGDGTTWIILEGQGRQENGRCLVDTRMVDALLNACKWHLSQSKENLYYVKGNPNGRKELLHRWLMRDHLSGDLQVRHLNGDGLDNRLENLAVGTQRDNEVDKKRHGRLPQGEDHIHSKLTEEDVLEILDLEGEMTQREIGERYGVDQKTVCDIFNGRSWSSVTGRNKSR